MTSARFHEKFGFTKAAIIRVREDSETRHCYVVGRQLRLIAGVNRFLW